MKQKNNKNKKTQMVIPPPKEKKDLDGYNKKVDDIEIDLIEFEIPLGIHWPLDSGKPPRTYKVTMRNKSLWELEALIERIKKIGKWCPA